MSIRNVLAVSIAGLLSIAVLATVGLILFSRRVQDESRVWVSADGGIQAAEEIELDLLRLNRLHGSASSAVLADIQQERQQLEEDLNRRLAEARMAPQQARERQIVTRASDAVVAYLRSPGEGELAERRLRGALSALGELIAFNVAEAEAANAQVARWNRLADVGAAIGGCLLMVGILGAHLGRCSIFET